MSYGQPCSRITTGPSAGPVSAYATSSNPALTCLSGPNGEGAAWVVPAGATAGCAVTAVCAWAAPSTPNSDSTRIEGPTKWRRVLPGLLLRSAIFMGSLLYQPWVRGSVRAPSNLACIEAWQRIWPVSDRRPDESLCIEVSR
ncbi:hypothetical protein D3C78_666210 [compost metagenome]